MQRKTKAPPLEIIFQQMLAGTLRTHEPRSIQLGGGARIAVSCPPPGDRVKFSIARKGARVGDTEIITFRAKCNVPAGAKRVPAEGQNEITDTQGEKWFQVGYIWPLGEDRPSA
jgi:hypothetical protein